MTTVPRAMFAGVQTRSARRNPSRRVICRSTGVTGTGMTTWRMTRRCATTGMLISLHRLRQRAVGRERAAPNAPRARIVRCETRARDQGESVTCRAAADGRGSAAAEVSVSRIVAHARRGTGWPRTHPLLGVTVFPAGSRRGRRVRRERSRDDPFLHSWSWFAYLIADFCVKRSREGISCRWLRSLADAKLFRLKVMSALNPCCSRAAPIL